MLLQAVKNAGEDEESQTVALATASPDSADPVTGGGTAAALVSQRH